MKIISTKVHGVLDYLLGFTLILLPWILDFNEYGIQSSIMVGLGMFTVLMSIFTRYELGVWKKIPMAGHLFLDALVAVILIASPWVFGFADQIYLPHVILGATELVAVILSDSKSDIKDNVMDKSDVYHQVSKDSNNPLEEGFRPRKKPATN
ncbi:MAG: SPW repeat protein [Bacteroidota bacterium]